MDDFVIKVFESVATQGPIVALLFYLYIQNGKVIEKKDGTIADLNKELRDMLERNLNKTHEAINNNTIALNAFREALTRNG